MRKRIRIAACSEEEHSSCSVITSAEGPEHWEKHTSDDPLVAVLGLSAEHLLPADDSRHRPMPKEIREGLDAGFTPEQVRWIVSMTPKAK